MIATGVLLINLGSPAAPTAPALRRYLREFLSDPRVVDLPRLIWWPILHGIILNTRPRRSAEKYARIWTAEGSPLRVHTERQAKLLRGYLGQAGCTEIAVEWAMRYGEPSIASGLDRLAAAGCSRILALPLYPQYSESTTASAQDAIDAWLKRRPAAPAVRTLHDFHDDAGYLGALASAVRAQWASAGRPDRLVISFHGLPQARIAQGDPYQAQCLQTARCLAANLGLSEADFLVTFQSRFGPAKWLEPYTQPTLEALAREGTGCVDVVCPGFVADCLETLEEIGIECRAAFLGAGGREFRYLPCLNERHEWIAALAELARANLNANWER